MAKYNGWANRDTWLVNLWLDNDQNNYFKMKRNKKSLLAMKKPKLILTLKRNFKFGDPINWKNVRVTEIKQNIREA